MAVAGEDMRFNLLDYLLLLAIGGSVIAAALKGFTYEVLMLAATVLAIGLAAWKYPALAAHWHGAPTPAVSFLAFLIILAAVLGAAALLARLTRGLVRGVGLGTMDRVFGAGLGLVRGVLVGAAIVLMLVAYPLNPGWVSNSRLAPPLLWVSRAIALALPHGLREHFALGLQAVPLRGMP